MRGVQYDRQAAVRRFRALEPRIREFPPIEGFQLWNRYYEAVDAEVLWAILRDVRPSRVVELGSGWSSKVIAAAVGPGCEHTAYDPYPRLPGVRVEQVAAQDVPERVFRELGERDVLFVDTTHTVKTGGDVNRIVLDVLPRLAPGVLVHFHDVLLPHEVDRRWLANGWYWSEQDLLHAFLVGNRDWEVVLAVHAASRADPQLAREFAPGHRDEHVAGAFWLRRARTSR